MSQAERGLFESIVLAITRIIEVRNGANEDQVLAGIEADLRDLAIVFEQRLAEAESRLETRTIDFNNAYNANKSYVEKIDRLMDRIDTLQDYAANLQRAIEHVCANKPLPDEVAKMIPHHADMIKNKLTAPQQEQP